MVEELPDTAGRELMLEQALAHVPGYVRGDRAVRVASLSGGSVNRSYEVSTPVGRFVVRVSPVTDAWLVADRSVEWRLHGLAAAAGLAPRIVHVGPGDRWLITEFAPGRLWTSADFADPLCLARLGSTLRRLHGLPPPDSGRFNLLQALSDYVKRITVADSANSAQLADYLRQAAQAWQWSGAADRPVAILHHDLHGSNVIDRGERTESDTGSAGLHFARDDPSLVSARDEAGLILIDWECAAVADPLLDIACVLSYYEVARTHADVLLRYSGFQTITTAQLAASVWLFDLHTFLWYRERRLRLVPTATEQEAEDRLAHRVARGVRAAL